MANILYLGWDSKSFHTEYVETLQKAGHTVTFLDATKLDAAGVKSTLDHTTCEAIIMGQCFSAYAMRRCAEKAKPLLEAAIGKRLPLLLVETSNQHVLENEANVSFKNWGVPVFDAFHSDLASFQGIAETVINPGKHTSSIKKADFGLGG